MISENVISDSLYKKLILLANLVFILVWFLSNEGLSFWDDFTYLNFANELNQGSFAINENHFTSRIAIIYPSAWVIDFLGINQYTMVVYPLICGLVLLNVFGWLGHRINRWIGIIGALMLVCDYHLITFSNHLFPEMPLTVFIFITLMGYYLVLKDEAVPRMAGCLSALALFAAFLTKTTMVLVLPLFLFLFINDRIKRRNGSFWLVFVSLSIFFVLLNGFWYMEVKGDFFYRFQNIADNHVATAKTFFDKDSATILARLTYLPFLGFLRGGFFIPLLIALPALLKLRKQHFKLDKAESLWPVATLFLLLTFWFMSTSWRYYSPLPTETRHIAFFIPIMIMTAATFWPHEPLFRYLKKRWVAAGLICCFVAIPVYAIAKSGRRNFRQEQALVKEYLVQNREKQWVITDGLNSYGYPYFYDFKQPEDIYLWFSELNPDTLRSAVVSEKAFVLVNRAYFNEEYSDSDNYLKLTFDLDELGYELVEKSKGGEVVLYEIKRK